MLDPRYSFDVDTQRRMHSADKAEHMRQARLLRELRAGRRDGNHSGAWHRAMSCALSVLPLRNRKPAHPDVAAAPETRDGAVQVASH
jgi:hypothetical protein